MATKAGTATVTKARKAAIMMFLVGRLAPLLLVTMAIMLNLTIYTIFSACRQKKVLKQNSLKAKMVVSWPDSRATFLTGRKRCHLVRLDHLLPQDHWPLPLIKTGVSGGENGPSSG